MVGFAGLDASTCRAEAVLSLARSNSGVTECDSELRRASPKRANDVLVVHIDGTWQVAVRDLVRAIRNSASRKWSWRIYANGKRPEF